MSIMPMRWCLLTLVELGHKIQLFSQFGKFNKTKFKLVVTCTTATVDLTGITWNIQSKIPEVMLKVNPLTIVWCQNFDTRLENVVHSLFNTCWICHFHCQCLNNCEAINAFLSGTLAREHILLSNFQMMQQNYLRQSHFYYIVSPGMTRPSRTTCNTNVRDGNKFQFTLNNPQKLHSVWDWQRKLTP